MKRSPYRSGFSLTELLVALGVLGLVAAAIVPRFLDLRGSASEAVAQSIAGQLNRTYAAWVATGGSAAGNNVATSDLVGLLTGALSAAGTGGGSYSPLYETSTAQNIRVSAPEGLELPATVSATLAYRDGYIAFDNSAQKFVVYSQRKLQGLTWVPSAVQQYTYPSGIGLTGSIPVAVGTSHVMVPIQPNLPPTDVYAFAQSNWKKVNYSSTAPANGNFTVQVSLFDEHAGQGSASATPVEPTNE